MMLPDVYGGVFPPRLFVACADGVPAPLGVAGIVCSIWGHDPQGFRFGVTVAPPYRRRGVGRALVRAVADEARGWGVRGLWAWDRAGEGRGAEFLRALGFDCSKRFLYFEGDAKRLHALVRPLSDRIVSGGGLPPGVRVVPLREAPAAGVVRLHQRHLSGDAARLAARIAGHGPDAFSPDHSVVLMADEAVCGAILYGWTDDVARIDAYAVDREWRRSPAGVVLLEAALSRGFSTGASVIRFACWEDVRDTIKMARRAEAREIGSDGQYVLDLARTGPRG
jgi:GNAT superfamily N-acetyltransferase